MEIVIKEIEDLKEVVRQLEHFAPDAKIFFLEGELGAGKTTFVKKFCEEKNIKDLVSSPTFSLVNEYLGTDIHGKPFRVFHLDLYRLKNTEEALEMGIEEYLYSGDYCFIEWPGIIESISPKDVVRIQIQLLEDSSRKFLFL
jgi:tRNA threonylcarbamoyladenosine biosynthesis protein TsaE